MSKELPYIDDKGQLHYEAYFGGNFRSFLRSSLPKDHPEYLYTYLEKHGIDWRLFFEEDGSRKGIDHEHGPIDKLFGLMPNKSRQRPIYTEEDMEAAFNGGAANAAKERVSGNKLTLPVLNFNQWLGKYKSTGTLTLEMGFGKAGFKRDNLCSLNIVMLPTKQTSQLYETNGKLYTEEYPNKTVNAGNQHLYFIKSAFLIKGDYALLDWGGNMNPDDLRVGEVLEVTNESIKIKNQFGNESHTNERYPNAKWYKVVATTEEFVTRWRPSFSFLTIYADCRNAGKPITEAMLDGGEIKPILPEDC